MLCSRCSVAVLSPKGQGRTNPDFQLPAAGTWLEVISRSHQPYFMRFSHTLMTRGHNPWLMRGFVCLTHAPKQLVPHNAYYFYTKGMLHHFSYFWQNFCPVK